MTDQPIAAVVRAAREAARDNRAFLGRAPRFLAANGIRQFLDIGSGIPTEGNVHEIASHFIDDSEDPWGIVATLCDAIVPGSYLVLGHLNNKNMPRVANAAEKAYNRAASSLGSGLATDDD